MFTIHLSAHSIPLLMSPSCLGVIVIVFLQQPSGRHAFEDFPICPCGGKRTYYIIHGSMLHTMALNTISTCNHMFSARRSYPVCSVMICDTESASLRELQSLPIRPQGQFSPTALLGEIEETKGKGKNIGINIWEILGDCIPEKSQAKRSQVQMQNKALYSSLEALFGSVPNKNSQQPLRNLMESHLQQVWRCHYPM